MYSRNYRQECFVTKRGLEIRFLEKDTGHVHIQTIYITFMYDLRRLQIFCLQLASRISNSGQDDIFPCYGSDSIASVR